MFLLVRKLLSGLFAFFGFLWGYISSVSNHMGSENSSDFSSPALLRYHPKRVSSPDLGPSYVQNKEQIRRVLERARTEYDFGLDGSAKLLSSVRDEERMGMYETIPHPGDPDIKIDVPQFYASSSIDEDGRVGLGKRKLFRQLSEGKLLTPDLTSIIGTFIPSTKQSKASKSVFVAKESERTIFLSILSHAEERCSETVTNILNAAANPHRVRVAVVDVTNSDDANYVPCDEPPEESCDVDLNQALCKFRQNVDIYELDPDMNAGTTFLRHIANRMYRGEYYAMQLGTNVDVTLAQRWDEELIRQFESANDEMAVITTYLSDMRARKHGHSARRSDVEIRDERVTLCHASYERDENNARRLLHLRENQVNQEPPMSKRSKPMLQPYWSSEFSFSRGHFILSIPYDPHLCGVDQQDEEISMALRAFTYGYDFYTPINSVAYRLSGSSKQASEVDGVFLELLDKQVNLQMCIGKEKKSQIRLSVLTEMKSEDDVDAWNEIEREIYGIGPVRQPKQFFSCFGVHVRQLITEQKLCDFVVSGNLHDEFIGNMRKDGMGIDYEDISFRFHELISIHKDNH